MKQVFSAVSKYFHITDRWLLLFCSTASACSILFLSGIANSSLAYSSTVWVQIAAAGIGIIAALVISKIDYHFLLKLWKLYVPLVFLLVIVTRFVGVEKGGNLNWIEIPIGTYSVSVQPSEFLKISFITTFAMHIVKVRENLNSIINLFFLCAHAAVHAVLIQVLQGDGGTVIVFICIFFIMLFFAGISWKYIGIAVLSLTGIIPLLWYNILRDDQKMRLLAVISPSATTSSDILWQQSQGIKALSFGGMQGTGIFAGQHVPVPEVYNDFIFTFIGESSGFMGCLGVVLLLGAIALKILYNSSTCVDEEGKLICVGVFAMIVSQMFINLGMCLSITPVIGVTLPFFSAGGSSTLSLYLGIGLVLSVYCHNKTALFYEK